MESKKGRALALDLMDSLLEGKAKPAAKKSDKDNPPTAQNDKDKKAVAKSAEASGVHLSPSEKSPPSNKTATALSPKPSPKSSAPSKNDPPAEKEETLVLNKKEERTSQVTVTKVQGAPAATVRSSLAPLPAREPLEQAESLRLAQERILDLEIELERLRQESEELAAAGETFQKKSDELESKVDHLERQYVDVKAIADDEKKVLQNALVNKEAELSRLKGKVEELELRLATNVQKIRVRERELENRLELAKRESAALVRNKDEIVLELKRQVDQLNLELENYRAKGQELNRSLTEKQDLLRKTVRTLRLSLSMLETDDEELLQAKKGKS